MNSRLLSRRAAVTPAKPMHIRGLEVQLRALVFSEDHYPDRTLRLNREERDYLLRLIEADKSADAALLNAVNDVLAVGLLNPTGSAMVEAAFQALRAAAAKATGDQP